MLTFPSLCAALLLLCSLFGTRVLWVWEEETAALCNCQAVWFLVSLLEETLACKYSSLRHNYALDHSGYRHLPIIYFGGAELINGAGSMRRKTLGNSYAALKISHLN